MRRALAAMAGVGVLAVCPIPAGAVPVGWHSTPVPESANCQNFLPGAAANGKNVFVVGGAACATVRSVALHWQHGSWRLVPSPGSGTAFFGADAVRGAAWAVGNQASGVLTARWDGSGFRVVPAPSPTPDSILLNVSALSSSSAWAVGITPAGPGAPAQPLVLRFGSGRWSVAAALRWLHGGVLSGVYAQSSRNVWAVGQMGTAAAFPNDQVAVIMHWDGRSWQRVASPRVSGGLLASVDGSGPGDVWAVGTRVVVDPQRGVMIKPVVEHWNGHRWTRFAVPFIGRYRGISPNQENWNAVVVLSKHNAWVAGYLEDANAGPASFALTEHWNGRRWSLVPVNGSAERAQLGDIAAQPTRLWASGNLDFSLSAALYHVGIRP